MQQLESVYARLQKNKKRRRELSKMFKDELAQHARYQEVAQELKALREERKSIENEVYGNAVNESNELDELKVDILGDQELLSDIALNLYVNNEQVEIVDENNEKWYPHFRVAFKRESAE